MRRLRYLRPSLSDGGSVLVLAYHAIRATPNGGPFAKYAVPPGQFAAQLDLLQEAGHRFLSLSEFLTGLLGNGVLPERAILVTFDDCYEDLRSTAAPLLAERGIPAVCFAVTRRLGDTNRWDIPLGAPSVPLLDASGLLELAEYGIEVGAHSRTHPWLTALGRRDLVAEVRGSLQDLEAEGFPRPRAFAYPGGAHDDGVAAAVAEAGFAAAFTVRVGTVTKRSDPYRLPRLEVRKGDTLARFRLRLMAARLPRPVRSALDRLPVRL